MARLKGDKFLSDYRDFDGTDASLDIALFEYGLIWKEIKPGEYKFIFGVGMADNEYNTFDYAYMTKGEWLEFFDDQGENWFDAQAVAGLSGTSIEDLKNGFPYTVDVAIAYYGRENIFGSSYYPFEIKNNS